MSEPLIRLRDGETAVVGYGSLLSTASLARSLKREYDGPFHLCRLEGWRRSWDVAMPNAAFYFEDEGARVYPEKIIYLNVRPDAGALVNCAVFVVSAAELEAMHGREWIYHPTNVADALRGVRVEGGEAVVYVAREEYLVPRAADRHEAAIRASYLRILDQALDQAGPEFAAEYERSTDPVPRHLVIDDALDPERPSPWEGYAYRP
jgi:hypothetical protein